MLILRRIVSGFRRLFYKTQVEQDMDEELRAYLETAAEQKMAAGLTREAAVRAARVEIGSLATIKERARDVGWESVVDSLWQDMRYALLFRPVPVAEPQELARVHSGQSTMSWLNYLDIRDRNTVFSDVAAHRV